jgi:hypothetical protein
VPPAAETAPPRPGTPPPELEQVKIAAKARGGLPAIEPQIGASTYTVTRQAIETQLGGAR